MNIIDQWYQAHGAETLSEFASTRSEMDHFACHTIDQEWLAYEAEQACQLILEKSEQVKFADPFPRIVSGTTCYLPWR